MNTIRNCFVWGLLLVLLSLATGCGNRQTAAVLDDVETYIQDRPDSALAALRAIDTTTLNSRRLHAQYALLHAMALDKNWIDTTDVNVVMPAVAYYDRHPVGDQKAKAFYYLGRIQENQGNIPAASISFLKAGKEVEHSNDLSLKALVYQAISNMYNKTYYDEEALRYTELSYALATEAGDSSKIKAARYRMAQDLNNVGRYAESDSLYQQMIDNNQVHPNLRASLLCNYALNLVTRKEEYAQAINLFEEVLSSTGTLGNTNFWGAYAYALARCGNTRRAESIFKQLSAAHDNTSIAYVYDYWKSQADAFLGDFDSAYRLQKAASDIQGENVKKVLKQSVIKAQKDFLEQANLESEKAARRRQIMAWSSVALLMIVLLVSLTAIRRYREKSRRRNQDLIEAVEDMMEKNNGLKQEYVHLGQEQYKALSDLCSTYYRTEGRTSQANAVCGEVRGYLKTLGVGENNYPALEQRVNEQFGDIMKHFRQEHPNHREPFYQTACYLFAGFKSRTIALILNQDEQNTYKTKSLLRKEIETEATPHQKEFLLLLDGASR